MHISKDLGFIFTKSVTVEHRFFVNNDESHIEALDLYLKLTDYLTQEGFFDPDMLDSSRERYELVQKLIK